MDGVMLPREDQITLGLEVHALWVVAHKTSLNLWTCLGFIKAAIGMFHAPRFPRPPLGFPEPETFDLARWLRDWKRAQRIYAREDAEAQDALTGLMVE
jgi:hypothetical protein